MDERRAVNMRATFGFFKPLDFHHPRVRLESVGDAALRRCRCHGRLRRAGAVATNVANVAARMRVHGGRCLRLRLGRSVQGVGALMEVETKASSGVTCCASSSERRQWRSSAPRSRPRASAACQSRSSGAPRSSHAFGTTLIEDVQQSAFRPSGAQLPWEHCSRRRNEAQEVPGSSAVPGLAFFLDTWHQLLKPTHGAHHWDL